MLADILTLPLHHITYAIIIGVVVGGLMTMTGVGGGVIIIPALQLSFAMPIVTAVGTASIIATLIKINAALNHIRCKNVNWSHVKIILISAVPALIIATEVIVRSASNPTLQPFTEIFVQGCVVITMVGAFVSLYLGRKSTLAPSNKQTSMSTALSVGALSGSVLGTTGIGGGVILLPALKNILGATVRQAVGSSIVIAVILSGVTAIRYSSSSQSNVAIGLIVVLSSFIGVKGGIKVLEKTSDDALINLSLFVILTSLIATIFL
ncbi:putative membrane protein [Vibrio maritimus]|uniref:Probable membrane transporter protein n=1 Tax=Vibrio maritimus TaxID=990268 RepID=A0A090TKC2_9VIBR|nr:putative membrane protein [Vibrio maritimus]